MSDHRDAPPPDARDRMPEAAPDSSDAADSHAADGGGGRDGTRGDAVPRWSERGRQGEPGGAAETAGSASADGRPRPQYGEYATPDQQRAAMAVPPDPDARAEDPPLAADAAGRSASEGAGTANGAAGGRGSAAPTDPRGVAAGARGMTRGGIAYRVITVGLLAFGLAQAFSLSRSFLMLDATLSAQAQQLGITDYRPLPAVGALGVIATVAVIVLWLAAVICSFALRRRGRLAFWVPLVAGVISIALTAVAIAVGFSATPDILERLSTPS